MVTFGSADQAVYLEYARGCTTATGEETLLTKPAAHDYGEVPAEQIRCSWRRSAAPHLLLLLIIDLPPTLAGNLGPLSPPMVSFVVGSVLRLVHRLYRGLRAVLLAPRLCRGLKAILLVHWLCRGLFPPPGDSLWDLPMTMMRMSIAAVTITSMILCIGSRAAYLVPRLRCSPRAILLARRLCRSPRAMLPVLWLCRGPRAVLLVHQLCRGPRTILRALWALPSPLRGMHRLARR